MRLPGFAAILLLFASVLTGAPGHAQSTLAAVKKRGEVVCGLNGQLPGFSSRDGAQWNGFEVDFCRALAAAVLGDANKTRFVPVTTATRFDDLRQGRLDVLMRNTILTLERTTGTGVRDAAVYYLDRQVVVASRRLNARKLADLHNGTVCILRNTPYDTALDEWFGANNLKVQIVLHDDQDSLYKALFDGRCSAVTQVMAALASSVVASGEAAKFIVLPDLVALHPLSAFVRTGDESWSDIVRWTFNVLLRGEELKLTQSSVGPSRTSANPEVRRLLGVEPGFGKRLGLDETWALNVLQQVGNYAEIYDRNVGAGSSLKFSRGVNALWSNGGVFYPTPLR